jgi:histone H3/H4
MINKMPPKKAPAKKTGTKSPAKKAVSKSPIRRAVKKVPVKKSGAKPPTKKIAKSPTKEVTTTKHLKDVLPKQVPKDIRDLTGKYMHNDIRKEAALFYDAVIPFIANPRYMPKDLFIDNITEDFVKLYGESFKDFLEKNRASIIDGCDYLKMAHKIFDLLAPNHDEWEDIQQACRTFLANILTQWAYKEKFIKKKDIELVIKYLASLREDDDLECTEDEYDPNDYIYPTYYPRKGLRKYDDVLLGDDTDDSDSDYDSDDDDSDD